MPYQVSRCVRTPRAEFSSHVHRPFAVIGVIAGKPHSDSRPSGLSRSCRDPGHLATCDAASAIDPHRLPASAWAVIRHAGGAPGRSRDLVAFAFVCLRQNTVFVRLRLSRSRDHQRQYKQQRYKKRFCLHRSVPFAYEVSLVLRGRWIFAATGAAFISGAKRSRRPADRSHGCFRVRAARPATICIATPNNHQQQTITVQITGRSSSNTTTYTETNAAAVARNVPAATNTSTRSIFGPTRAFRMSNRDAREGVGGVSIPK